MVLLPLQNLYFGMFLRQLPGQAIPINIGWRMY